MTHTTQQSGRARGFTMIEMLVTLAITIVLMLFVGQIFGHVSDAAKSGLAISHILESARVITGQVSADGSNMVGASEGGFLIIQTATSPAAPLDENDTGTRTYFADQVMWVRLRGDLEPMVPANDISYSNSADDANHVRIYYGHALKANPDGSAGTAFGAAGLNEYASQWVMGRHAMFLADSPPNVTNHSSAAGYAGTISGTGGTYFTGFSGSQTVQFGVSDVADQTLSEINAGTIDASTVGFGTGTSNRLIVNPAPVSPDFNAWAVAQISPIMATGVSDIIVEYANVTTGSGGITWIRGNLVCTSSTTNWPDLIRIRFRLHGPRGKIAGPDGEPGVMYEKIIRVKQ